jgi:hypothetical protein
LTEEHNAATRDSRILKAV